jgi:sec-independent protein translocase protein TatC
MTNGEKNPGPTTPATRPDEMPLTQHLAELRTRIVNSLLALLVSTGVCLNFSDWIFKVVQLPMRKAFQDFDFIGTGPADAFIVGLQVAVLAGLILASPVIVFQLWRFIAPGLLENEKKYALPFIFLCTLFFLSGVFFCFQIVLPTAFEYFYLQYTGIEVRPQIKIDDYLGFVVKMLLVFGFVFELPILSFFLARMGLLSHTWLIKQARLSIVIIFVIAAIFTPPDVISQLLLAIPLLVIYGMSIAIAFYWGKPRNIAS